LFQNTTSSSATQQCPSLQDASSFSHYNHYIPCT
jgi:hypothetical protein